MPIGCRPTRAIWSEFLLLLLLIMIVLVILWTELAAEQEQDHDQDQEQEGNLAYTLLFSGRIHCVSLRRPSWSRVFTVPSGVFVVAAISRWLSPLK